MIIPPVPVMIIIVLMILLWIIIKISVVQIQKSAEESITHLCDVQEGPVCVDIAKELESEFDGSIVSTTQKTDFEKRYTDAYLSVCAAVKKLELFRTRPSDVISKFISDYESITLLVAKHNELVVDQLLDRNKDFFDRCLKYPLDEQQRRSIVSEEDNCLVVSSAGSGKTSSIIGKVKYLTDIVGVSPEKILLISYTNKAAAELTERLETPGLKGYTFHKLAIDIIGQYTGIKPSICDNADALFIKIYHDLLADTDFKRSVVEYFVDYQMQESAVEQAKIDRQIKLSEQKRTLIKAVYPDMDGLPVYVKSEQEKKLCFVLSSLGVKFRYEEKYEFPLADERHSQYQPDFSIYFELDGKTNRIYLEHFGVDDHACVPVWFAKDKNMSYEEANKRYNDGITWKIAAHEKFGTKLLTTSSADFFYYSDIKDKLKQQLSELGVPIKELSDEELYGTLLPDNGKKEKVFIRLISTFVTLLKSSCCSFKEILNKVKDCKDERSLFILKNIFRPFYERYVDSLAERGEIDFTDAILQATDICSLSKPVDFDYIIVDEFQDISIDRYKFLKALRNGNLKQAKLYCVGDDWQSIYRFSGSDMSLFNQFADYFGPTEINRIETTYRFGEPLVSLSSKFIQRNSAQISKSIRPYSADVKTELLFYAYDKHAYCDAIENVLSDIPVDKTVFLLGRYSFDDYYLSYRYKSVKRGGKFYYLIGNRQIEFLTVHKSKGLEADYVILLQCNKDTYGFPSMINDDPVLSYVLTERDNYPYGEERRLFYVAMTRAKCRTIVMYDNKIPSVFVEEFLRPENVTEESYMKHPNANKRWSLSADKFLMSLHNEGKSIKYIADKMGRSQTSIIMRIGKLKGGE